MNSKTSYVQSRLKKSNSAFNLQEKYSKNEMSFNETKFKIGYDKK